MFELVLCAMVESTWFDVGVSATAGDVGASVV